MHNKAVCRSFTNRRNLFPTVKRINYNFSKKSTIDHPNESIKDITQRRVVFKLTRPASSALFPVIFINSTPCESFCLSSFLEAVSDFICSKPFIVRPYLLVFALQQEQISSNQDHYF